MYRLSIIVCLLFIASQACKKENHSKQILPVKNSIEKLQGTWRNKNSSSPDFKIENDSVTFLQDDVHSRYKCELAGDSLVFHFPRFSYTFRLYSFAGDSIHLVNEMNSNTFLKVK